MSPPSVTPEQPATKTMDRLTLLAHALELETEAVDRYQEMAAAMHAHNNHEVAELFAKMAQIESKHVGNVETAAGDAELPRRAPWEWDWLDGESPEVLPLSAMHYRLTPHLALQEALRCEERAVRFCEHAAALADDDDTRRLAEEMAGEEREHVRLIREWLQRFPKPAADWSDDLDPPAEID